MTTTTYAEQRRQSFAEQRSDLDVLLDEEAVAHVKRGIELLKEQHGPDFADHIDPKTLKLSDGSACVLGQLYGDYAEGVRLLGICGADYGFDSNGASYSELDAAWFSLLEEEYAARAR